MQPHSVLQALRSGAITPSEHLATCKKVIQERNHDLLALRVVADQRAEKHIEQLEKRQKIGAPLGALYGLFFSAKDHIDVQGFARSEGSAATLEESTPRSAFAVQRLLDQDATCLGKGNMAELGRSYATQNTLFGTTKHPYDSLLSPGGSSGGDAVAVASGMVDFALAADSGGSIRVPAAACGVFGLFPTLGSISDGGLSKETTAIARLFRGLGPIASSLELLQTVFGVLKHFDPSDPRSAPALPSRTDLSSPSSQFLIVEEMNGIACDEITKKALNHCARKFNAFGYQQRSGTLAPFESFLEPFIVLSAQASLSLEDLLRPKNQQALRAESPHLASLRKRIKQEMPPLAPEELLLAWHAIETLRNSSSSLFDSYDFILLPTTAEANIPAKLGPNPLRTELQFQFSMIANALALPALTFPVEVDSKKVGVQLLAPRFCERRLFELARVCGAR